MMRLVGILLWGGLGLLPAFTASALATSNFQESAPRKTSSTLAPTSPRSADKNWIEPTTGMGFVSLPGGCFAMGSAPYSEAGREDDEQPVHEVCLDPFWMGQHEVTNSQFILFLNLIGRKNPKDKPWFATLGKKRDVQHHIIGGMGRFGVISGQEGGPMTDVSWHGAQAFAQWLSQRNPGTFHLPSEAQWEYACRGGSTTPFHFGKTISAQTQANFNGQHPYDNAPKEIQRPSPTPVGSFPANTFGLHDLHGNVWEWLGDRYDEGFYGQEVATQKNPCNDCDETSAGGSRVIRGGSWKGIGRWLRCANRNSAHAGEHDNGIGFRLVYQPPADSSSGRR
ncbi:MAG: formylglycine-generating enzyme family protein [Magnetococcales bacterium]|nr:formylglycine-generating enzyme family protein [Magnetococcales bacterium]